MRKIFNAAKWSVTLGSAPQAFLGAKWIQSFLRRVPESKKRIWALRILSLSPHYFIFPDAPKYENLSFDDYLETVCKELYESRLILYERIFKDYLAVDSVVLDYGCGPGFLAKIVAEHTRKVFACDISDGALACARIINSAPNLEYLRADEIGLASISDESLDAILSFAMIQHISDDIFEIVLENCRKKLKPGGTLIFHIQLEDSTWRTEKQWKADQSFAGKIKFRYGLHCFGRTVETHREIVSKHRFGDIKIESIANFLDEDYEDIKSQYLLTARKSR